MKTHGHSLAEFGKHRGTLQRTLETKENLQKIWQQKFGQCLCLGTKIPLSGSGGNAEGCDGNIPAHYFQ